jgi:hypothetical protein
MGAAVLHELTSVGEVSSYLGIPALTRDDGDDGKYCSVDHEQCQPTNASQKGGSLPGRRSGVDSVSTVLSSALFTCTTRFHWLRVNQASAMPQAP